MPISIMLLLISSIAIAAICALAVVVLLRTGSLRDLRYVAKVIRAFRRKAPKKAAKRSKRKGTEKMSRSLRRHKTSHNLQIPLPLPNNSMPLQHECRCRDNHQPQSVLGD